MKRACLQQNTNTYEQNHASSIRPLKINFVRMKTAKIFLERIYSQGLRNMPRICPLLYALHQGTGSYP